MAKRRKARQQEVSDFGPPERANHDDLALDEGIRRARVVTQRPIDRYKSRGLITPDQHQAAERFRNDFDFVIVAVSLLSMGGAFAVMRALRILRVLRAVSIVPSLRRVVEGLLTALPGMGSVFLLMSIIFYIGAVMATKLFSASFPEWFGSIGASLYTLFQVMTLESWSMGIVRPVLEVYPYAWAFFVPFIMVTTFAVVNLIVGLVVNSMQDAHAAESNAATDAYRDEVLERLRKIEERLNDG